MDGCREISETRLKEEKSEVKINSNICDKISSEGEDEEENIQHDSFCSIVKRYQRYDLLSIRNAQQSIHYPHCALRPELQALSIWTCRLRCELQYLGLWRIPNTGNPYGNCSCNGSCQSYACDGQTYLPTNSQVLNSQMCYGNVQQSQQLQPLQTSSSPTLSSKKATRSRERFLNYQRCINTELIRATSPSCGSEGSIQYNLNHQIKPAFIDHRSISSSHLMPAFAKRRMGHANALHGHSAAGSNVISNGGHKTEHLYNDDEASESSTLENSVKPRKDSVKAANNQNDYQIYKPAPNSRLDKNDQSVDNQSGWINLVKTINSDFSPSNNKVNNAGSVNKKLMYERRIGSGRLVPREVSWDMRIGSNKQVEKENTNVVNNNVAKDKDMAAGEVDKLNNRNSSTGRYSDSRLQERRIFDRRISSSEDSNNGGNKRYTTTNLDEERNNFDSNCHQQTPHFTGQRSMSFRRREYVDHKDNHRDFRDFREQKDSRETKEQRGDQHHHHNHHRDHKEEPEWFIEGPTSQHDTIELRGFEETDESQQSQVQKSSDQYLKSERNSSESSLRSHNSSNVNLSTKDNFDISSKALSNPNNTTNITDEDIDNVSNCNNDKETATPNIDVTDVNESKLDIQQIVTNSEEFENSDKRRSNVTELFFDNFLNIEALENTLIGSGNDQSILATNDDGGTSRFSRWFFTNSSNTENSNDEFNNNPPNKEKSNRLNKDLNESDFNSFMSFLKCNNFPTPELPKSLPSNVSALSVEELEARMRKMDSIGIEKTNSDGGGKNLVNNEAKLTKRSERESETESSHSIEINTQDVEAFRKLLDQLGKPRVDISMNIIPPIRQEQQHSLTTHAVGYPAGISPIPTSNSLPQSNMAKQEYILKIMRHQQQIINHQQNVGKKATPLLQHHHPHNRIPQITPQQQTENISLMSVPHHIHNHHIPMILGHPQKRLDVQYLIQSVVREELSRNFLERELKNPNISSYTKEIISTVLKETSRYNLTLAGGQNAHDSIERSSNIDISAAPNHLMQSLARGEVSLNLLEHELNKLNNVNIVNETPTSGAFKDRSRCGTPLVSSINVASIQTSGSVIVPISSQVVPAQKQNPVLPNESVSSDQQLHPPISSLLRSHLHEDSTLHMPTQRELQMHTQAIMQNALFKKKLEMEQHETLRRRQGIPKQHELEPENISQQHQQQSLNSNSTMSQQGHQQSSRHINSPTPLAFTPTSVLRKMTAEKESITSSTQTTTITTSSPQQTQPHLQQSHLKISTHAQMSYQHSNQPRMILGGGNFQYINQQQHQIASIANGSPQVSPQQKSQLRSQPPGPLKWPLIHSSIESNHSVLNNMSNKPLGRPILKGPAPIQPLLLQNAHNPMGQNLSNVNQNPQSIQAGCQMHKYPSIPQQPRQIIGQQFSTHLMKHQTPTSPQNNMQQQLHQQQRSVVMQHQQIQQQNDLGNHAPLPPPAHHPPCNDNNSVTNLNYQRDGGLSPTSNQLAQWFSPELLAQASAGKLPLLNMNQALSLEEFERSIQHSSTAVNN